MCGMVSQVIRLVCNLVSCVLDKKIYQDFELQLQEETWVTSCAYAPNEVVIALG